MNRFAVVATLLSSLVATASLRAAQPELDIKPVAVKIVETEERITLRYVKPSLMAYWLDRAHQPLPQGFSVGNFPLPANGATKLPASLPQGITSLKADDTTNTILVVAKPDIIEELREIVAPLDKPIPQIEVSAKLIEVLSAALPPMWQSKADSPVISYHGAKGFEASLNELIEKGTARVVSHPRVTTFNQLRAEIASLQGPIYTEFFDDKGQFLGYHASEYGHRFTFVPSLGTEGDINVVSQVEIGQITQRDEKGALKVFKELPPNAKIQSEPSQYQTISTSANVKDGDTLIIGGLREGDSGESHGREWLISLTARQIHHVDDLAVEAK